MSGIVVSLGEDPNAILARNRSATEFFFQVAYDDQWNRVPLERIEVECMRKFLPIEFQRQVQVAITP